MRTLTASNHRAINSLAIIIAAAAIIASSMHTEQSIEECSDRLWEHITKTEVPKDIR